jgi:hypothetical protein
VLGLALASGAGGAGSAKSDGFGAPSIFVIRSELERNSALTSTPLR